MKLQQEQLKTERKTVNREQRKAERQRRFKLKQQKRKEKHRGGEWSRLRRITIQSAI